MPLVRYCTYYNLYNLEHLLQTNTFLTRNEPRQAEHSLDALTKELSTRCVLSYSLQTLVCQFRAYLVQYFWWLHISNTQSMQQHHHWGQLARPDALPVNQPTVSKHWRQLKALIATMEDHSLATSILDPPAQRERALLSLHWLFNASI